MNLIRQVWLLPIIAGLLQIGGASCGRMGTQGQIHDRLEAIRKAGQPHTLADLNKWYHEPPAADNAAPLLEESFALVQLSEADTANVPLLGKEKLPEPGVPVPAATRRKITQLLAKNQQALTLLHQAGARKECRFPIVLKGPEDVLLPHLIKLKRSLRLLELEAVSNAESTNGAGAVESLVTSFHLARLLDQEPFLISQLVRFAIDNTSCTTLERILSTVALSDEQLARLQSALQQAQGSAGLTRGLIGDRCLGIAILEMPAKEREALVARSLKDQGNDSMEQSSWEGDFAFYLQGMEEAIASSQLPLPNALERSKKIALRATQAKRKKYPYSAESLDSFARLFPKHAQHEAHLRCAEAGVAVQRYRLAHQNALPASLAETVPGTLRALPVDPFDGTPLQYRRDSAIRFTIASSTDDSKRDLTFKVSR